MSRRPVAQVGHTDRGDESCKAAAVDPPSPAIDALRLIEAAGFQVALVGGWSRQLLGLESPRAHSDIDLVVTDVDIAALDHWLSAHDEIVAKRVAHKRAFRLDGTMVELHLVTRRKE